MSYLLASLLADMGKPLFPKPSDDIVLRIDSEGNPLPFIAYGHLYMWDKHLNQFRKVHVGDNRIFVSHNHNGITDEEYLSSVMVLQVIKSIDGIVEVFRQMKENKITMLAVSCMIPHN